VVAVDGTAIKAYSQRSLDNKTGKATLKLEWEEHFQNNLKLSCVKMTR
jgi:hypothetical protein